MKALRQEDRRQLEQFLSTLFLPDDLIELRFIESWVSRGEKRSRVVRAAEWFRREELVLHHRAIADLARRERANVYFGVCPRQNKGDSQDNCIETVRCLWCDVDNISAAEAFERWNKARIPRPSIVVSSGSGIHGYWLLDRSVWSSQGRALITAMLPHFYRSFGGDHVQNLSRILRPPGTVNCKDARNGRPPQPCTLLRCQPEIRYPLGAFSRWIELAEPEERQSRMPPGCAKSPTKASARRILATNAEATVLIQQLGKPSRDRSRRDFAVVCDLLRLGLTKEEIRPLVCGRSKFESNGWPYFDLTIANAERRMLVDQSRVGRLESST